MFTGIVEAVGRIIDVSAHAGDEGGVRLIVDTGALDTSDVAIGDSVAINGACMTVVAKTGGQLVFDVSAESLRWIAGLSQPGEVNLECALRFGDRVGGHLVSGHVDGVGTVTRFEPDGESRLLELEAPAGLARYIAVKGSITVNGVSLTVNRIDGTRFSVNLIPHTLAVTTLGVCAVGCKVNLEVDLIARHLERLLEARSAL